MKRQQPAKELDRPGVAVRFLCKGSNVLPDWTVAAKAGGPCGVTPKVDPEIMGVSSF